MMNENKEKISQLAEILKKASYPIAFTGAGISTESGIPDFRSVGTGLWTKVDPEQISTRAMKRDPVQFYKDYQNFVAPLEKRTPNLGHIGLARLAELGYCKVVVTQNVDGLHQLSGSPRVLEVHGHVRTSRCSQCGKEYSHEAMMEPVREGKLPSSSCCDALLRTNVVLFGDPMADDFSTAWGESAKADFCLTLGSSLSVYPAAEVPFRAGSFGIINRDLTGKEGQAIVSIQGEIGEIMEELIRYLENNKI